MGEIFKLIFQLIIDTALLIAEEKYFNISFLGGI